MVLVQINQQIDHHLHATRHTLNKVHTCLSPIWTHAFFHTFLSLPISLYPHLVSIYKPQRSSSSPWVSLICFWLWQKSRSVWALLEADFSIFLGHSTIWVFSHWLLEDLAQVGLVQLPQLSRSQIGLMQAISLPLSLVSNLFFVFCFWLWVSIFLFFSKFLLRCFGSSWSS